MATSRTRAAHNKSAASFDEDHLIHLRPVKVSTRTRQERFIFPELGDLVSTSFELCPDELNFANTLLGGDHNHGMRRHNLWVYRVDQKKFAGDFVIVDVSGQPQKVGQWLVPRWEVFVLDLKMNGALQLGGGGAGIQFQNWRQAAHTALLKAARSKGLMPNNQRDFVQWERHVRPKHVWRMVGDRREILDFFKNVRLVRRQRRRTNAGPGALTDYFRSLRPCSIC